MLRSDLAFTLSKKIRRYVFLDEKVVKNAVDLIVETLAEEVSKGRRVEIRGFGAFTLNCNRNVPSRNPKTGEKINVSRARISFRAGNDLRNRVNNKP